MIKGIVLFLSFICLSSCAQTQKGIRSLGAYVTVRQHGTLPVDDLGNPIQSSPDSIFTVFVETGNQKVDWGIVWKGKKAFSVIPALTDKTPAVLGSIEQPSKLKKPRNSKNYKLWQLELVPHYTKLAPPAASRPGQILINGKYGSVPFSISVVNIQVLKSPPSY